MEINTHLPDFDPFLVTGGAGFLGSALVRRLVGLGMVVHVIDVPGTDTRRLASVTGEFMLHEGDLRDASFTASTLKDVRPCVVFHCAAAGVSGTGEGTAALVANTTSVMNLLHALDPSTTRIFVNTGSCFEYGYWSSALRSSGPWDAFTHYAASKVLTSSLCHTWSIQHDVPIVTLRPFCLYGDHEPPHRIISAAILAVLERETLEMTDGRQVRDFVYVEDAVDAYLACLRLDTGFPCELDMGSGTEVSVRDTVRLVEDILGQEGLFMWDSRPRRDFEPVLPRAATETTCTMIGWEARTSLREGIARTIAWHKACRGPESEER